MTVTRMEASRCHGFWGPCKRLRCSVCLCKLTPAREQPAAARDQDRTPCTTPLQPGLAWAISDRGLHARLLDYHPHALGACNLPRSAGGNAITHPAALSCSRMLGTYAPQERRGFCLQRILWTTNNGKKNRSAQINHVIQRPIRFAPLLADCVQRNNLVQLKALARCCVQRTRPGPASPVCAPHSPNHPLQASSQKQTPSSACFLLPPFWTSPSASRPSSFLRCPRAQTDHSP